jgi:S1-C subfamily serine protease
VESVTLLREGRDEIKFPEMFSVLSKSKSYHLTIFLSAALVLLVGGVLLGNQTNGKTMRSEISRMETLRKEIAGVQASLKKSELESIQLTIETATQKALPAVVAIRPARGLQFPRAIRLYDDFQKNDSEVATPYYAPIVSGILIGGQGHILTSDKIIEAGNQFNILFESGLQQIADLIASDKVEHLALLKLKQPIEPVKLPDFRRAPLPQGTTFR